MASGWCPDCDRLRPISPTGERIGLDPNTTARYWRLDVHKCRGPLRAICAGAGEKI